MSIVINMVSENKQLVPCPICGHDLGVIVFIFSKQKPFYMLNDDKCENCGCPAKKIERILEYDNKV